MGSARRVMELTTDDVLLLELLRKLGAMTLAQLAVVLSPPALADRLSLLAGHGLVDVRLDLYLITDGGIAALKDAIAALGAVDPAAAGDGVDAA